MLAVSKSKKSFWTALCALGVVAVAVTLLASGSREAVVGSAPNAQEARNIHGSGGDALDWDTPGITLAEALSQMGGTVALPPASVVGEPQKVVLDETARDETGNPGLLILYSSGIKLMVSPGGTDLGREAAADFAPFEDKRAKAFELVVDRGTPRMVTRGGVQVIRGGSRSEVMPRVTWNLDGYTYAAVGTSQDVTIGELMKVANGIR
jgi:hypothetical protein